MSIKTLTQNNLSWINIETVNDEALQFLKTNYHFHHLDLEDIAAESTHIPKIDLYKNYLFLVLHFPQWNQMEKKINIFQINFFVGENFVITIQHHKNYSKEMRGFFYRCMKNRRVKQDWMTGTSGYLLYNIIEALFHEARPILNNIGKHVSLIENEVFSGEQNTQLIKELAGHRRNILIYRSIIDPQRHVITTLTHIQRPFLDESLSIYFDDIRDYLDKLWAIIETYKETINGLFITVESFMNQRTNKVLTILTVISVAMLPHTLLFNLYGMNLPILPLANYPRVVWLIFTVLTIVVATSLLVVLRRIKKTGWF